MNKITYGRIRMRIMQVLWGKKKANAQEITRAINELEPIAHSTVQTHLRALEDKGALAHSVDDRTFVYFPLVEKEKVMKSKTMDFIEVLFSGSAESLVSYLANNKYITREEMKKAIQLFDKEEK
ncbi:MAG: BlaI/MecI/CopY family transcriptional regulator [Candidatus Latescibacteria bacterium]|jgi:BlaI family transcriptional regulator, penicillinase repressor|nr:BlaI/MecI/CopY family transcriptional regulator [Candidatus Latescibacterota bacterium]